MFTQLYEEKFMRFPQGKRKALTFSYDDGVKADVRLLEIFSRYGLKGTFNLNSKRFDCPEWHGKMDWEQTYAAFKDCGQEIALHGARHAFLDKMPLAEAVKEVADNRAFLEENFGTIVRGMAYAYGAFNEEIKSALAVLGVAYARTTQPTYDFSLPRDWLEWNPTCHHTEKQLGELSQKFFAREPLSEKKHRESLLFYVWGHSFEFDDDGNWDVMENLAKTASEHKDEVWFATNGEIYDYARAYENLVFSMDGERVYNPSAIPVWLELRGRLYEIPSGKTVSFAPPLEN